MIINVVADATFDDTQKCGWYAFWIEGPNSRKKEAGFLRGASYDSTHAELASLGKAIRVAIESFDLVRGDTIVARCDCEHAVDILSGKNSPKDARSFDADVLRTVRTLCSGQGIELVVQHTKGHQGTATIWSAMNTWCDHSAKAEKASSMANNRLLSAVG